MIVVEFARHLHRFFPALAEGPVELEARTAAEAVAALESRFPGLGGYIVDEQGSLRPHVNLFLNDWPVRDRKSLSDPLDGVERMFVLQALSGG